jgi:hypothetical protein
MLVGKVTETFEIKGRGVLVATDTTYEKLPCNFKTGDPIELRMSGEIVLRTRIDGFCFVGPNPYFLFFLKDIAKAEVVIGSEVWAADRFRLSPSDASSL